MTIPEAVVVFGASGFVGRNIVDALQGLTPLIIGVNSSGKAVPGCSRTVQVASLDDIPSLPSSTAIINVAAFRYFASRFAKDQRTILSANAAITDAVYHFALAREISEVRVASSSAVYPASWTILDDTIPLDLNGWPHDGEAAYAWSKRWGEIVAELWFRRSAIHTQSFRLSNPYGPFDTLDESEAHVATAFAIRACTDEDEFEVRGNPDTERDFVFVGDVAQTFVKSLSQRGIQCAANLAYGQTHSVRELARAAMQAAGTERPLALVSPSTASSSPVMARRPTAQKMRELMPSLPTFMTLDEGMRKTVAWYREQLA